MVNLVITWWDTPVPWCTWPWLWTEEPPWWFTWNIQFYIIFNGMISNVKVTSVKSIFIWVASCNLTPISNFESARIPGGRRDVPRVGGLDVRGGRHGARRDGRRGVRVPGQPDIRQQGCSTRGRSSWWRLCGWRRSRRITRKQMLID